MAKNTRRQQKIREKSLAFQAFIFDFFKVQGKTHLETKLHMNKPIFFVVLAFLLFSNVDAQEFQQFEIPNTQVIPISDLKTDKQYELYVKLPEGYEKNKDTQYPVIYFTDALWHIELLSGATAFLLEDVILVGISWQKNVSEELREEYGAHVSRFSDYSFWTTANPNHPKLQFGLANHHLAFIRNQVFSYVEKHYRASPQNRSYFGYSLGGLFGAYTLLNQPDTYKNYILGSPSVQLLTKRDSGVEFRDEQLRGNVFITHGHLEEGRGEHIEAFVALLKKTNNKHLSIKHEVIKGDHQTAFPATGVSSLTWLADLLKE